MTLIMQINYANNPLKKKKKKKYAALSCYSIWNERVSLASQ